MVPAGTPQAEARRPPPLILDENYSEEWAALNAIAFAHALTPGANPELERARPPSKDALRGVLREVSEAGEGWVNIIDCERSGCDFVIFNGRAAGKAPQHSCR